MRALSPTLIMVVLLLCPAPVFADTLVEQAKEAYANAEFEEALQFLEMAEGAETLSHDELTELLLTRAMVRFAVQDEEGMSEDLRALASIDPNHELSSEVPPSVREAFGRVGAEVDEGLRLNTAVERIEQGIAIEISVENDVANLVRRTNITCRVDGGAPTRGSGTSLRVTADASSEVVCEAEALGPGRALLAETRREIQVSRFVTANEGVVEGGGVPAWPFIVGGIVLVGAAVAIVLAIVLSGPNEQVIRGPIPEM